MSAKPKGTPTLVGVVLAAGGVLFAGIGALLWVLVMAPRDHYRLEGALPDTTDPIIVEGAQCRYDQRSKNPEFDFMCMVPLSRDDAPMSDYAKVTLLFEVECNRMPEASQAKACELTGTTTPLDLQSAKEQAHIAKRYPGFAGSIIRLHDPKEDDEMRYVAAGLVGFGLLGLLAGLAALGFGKARKPD